MNFLLTRQISKARKAQILAEIRKHFANERHAQGILAYLQHHEVSWQEFNEARRQGMLASKRKRSAVWKAC